MFRKLVVTMGVVAACGLAVGCGGSSGSAVTKPAGDKSTVDKAADMAKEAGKKAEEVGKDAVAKGKDAVEKGKEALAKGKEDLLKSLGVPEEKTVQEKINGLTGDAKTEATKLYDEIKKMLGDFTTSDTLVGWKEKLEPLIKQLKEKLKL